MTRRGRFEKWASGLLGVVCLLLVLNLALRSGARVGASRSTGRAVASAPPAVGGREVPKRAEDDLARYEPGLHLDLLKQLRARPLPELPRSPFQFEVRRVAEPHGQLQPGVVVPPPTGPPPVPLKALGYSEKSGGLPEAIVSDDQQIYVVHEGEKFAKRFTVTRISPTLVEVQDEARSQTVRLPISQ